MKQKPIKKESSSSLPSKRPNYFAITAPLVGIIAGIAVFWPEILIALFKDTTIFFYEAFDWLIMWLPLAALIFGITLALSRYGKIRLGGEDAKPEFSLFSWMAMLFTAGIGVGIVFYGPIEALWHYLQSPIGINKPGITEPEAMENAMSTALWIWGIPAWALYSFGGIIIAYFAHQHESDFSPSAPIEVAFKDKKWAKSVGVLVLILAIFAIAISVSSSIAMATAQVSSGIKAISGIDFSSNQSKIVILFLLFLAYTAGAVLPIAKGMKVLGDLVMYCAIALMIFIFITGPTHYFMSVIVKTIGSIITDTIPHSFQLYLFQDRSWVTWFPMAYWVWWITWTPFVGVFLAKISKGRTIRQFILASILIPTGFMVIWFSIFSGFSLLETIEGEGILEAVASGGGYEGAIYHLLEFFPFSSITKVVTVFLFIGFVVTTVMSAVISLGIMTSHDGRTESRGKALIWSIFIALIAFAVVFTGEIEGIKAVGSFIGFPFVFILFLMAVGLFKQIRRDERRGER